ncbi:SDR family oxidoreductase [Acinetobacter ursingii]|uniref:SDR family oxidoreductase n=1 Tax=Acinetobacter ursingii TaxID=108980 RepID=UPI00249C691E|nr:SDR family oxidoreductase [Acinetobacter ursingii]MDI3237681.1 SDR family oxidoreductase [Acinetobacter ursingii]
MVSQFRISCIAYAFSKAALIGLTRVAALELGAYGITVNAIGPGPIETELFKQANPKDAPETEQILKNVPVQRFGQPEDIAHACDFFLSEKSGFIRGKFYMSVGA